MVCISLLLIKLTVEKHEIVQALRSNADMLRRSTEILLSPSLSPTGPTFYSSLPMCVSYLRDEMVRLRDILTQKDTQLEKFLDMLVKRRINFFL
jgi:hypothetical protein